MHAGLWRNACSLSRVLGLMQTMLNCFIGHEKFESTFHGWQ